MPCAACGLPRLEPHLAVGHAAVAALIPTTDAFGRALADIARCRACGHMQLACFPPAAELAEAYGEAASTDYVEEEAGQRDTARRVLERVEAWSARGRLLDLGCWVGFLLAEARDRGWAPLGVEPSAWAAGYARDELGLEVLQEDLFAADLPPRAFGAVVLGDVIEHLPDPGRALGRLALLLADGGVICLVLPDAGSRLARIMGARWWSVIPTHVQYFTRTSLRVLLERSGYEVLEMRTAPKAFTVRYYLERLCGYSPPLARALVAGARRAGVAERMWAPDFRDRMLVVARRHR